MFVQVLMKAEKKQKKLCRLLLPGQNELLRNGMFSEKTVIREIYSQSYRGTFLKIFENRVQNLLQVLMFLELQSAV